MKTNRKPAARPVAPDRRPAWLSLIACAGVLAASSLAVHGEGEPADATPNAAATAPSPTPAIPSADVEKTNAILSEFSDLFEQRKFREAGRVLEEAEKLAPKSEAVISARAGVLAETGEIAKARELYLALAASHPKAFVPKYNLAELLCIEKKYGKARAAFEELLKQYPDNGLIQYKIVLTHLAERDGPGAAEALKALDQPRPTPFLYYGTAAVAIYGGNITSGRQMIAAAEREFGPGRQKLLHDSLAEIGLAIQEDYPPESPEAEGAAAAQR